MTKTQEVILSIYKHVSSICRKHNIPFYAIGGTCIGAIRHNGFIPWDDDLDIAVPIEYWDLLISTLEKELPSNLYLYNSDKVKPYRYIWLKVCDRNTTFIEECEYNLEEAYKGIFIDIMPISGVPNIYDKFIKRLEFLRKCNSSMRFPRYHAKLKGHLKDFFLNTARKCLPYNYFSKKYIAELKKYPLIVAKFTGYVWHSEWMPRLIFPQSFFNGSIEWQFEDTTIPVPREYDKYLSQQFGDYMKLPPEDKREIHNGIVDVNRPFSTYYGTSFNNI